MKSATNDLNMDGSSPRVRSRLDVLHRFVSGVGIISACAEQTSGRVTFSSTVGDHLRVCGADFVTQLPGRVASGSSPRVRSRRRRRPDPDRLDGIISACAEQTARPSTRSCGGRDHLRVCGADPGYSGSLDLDKGSSPRVRSRRNGGQSRHPLLGIISACAEQTTIHGRQCSARRDHLRVCGADENEMTPHRFGAGSSPRVRSRPAPVAHAVDQGGIISACAEQTIICGAIFSTTRDHLRVCGAD